MIYLILLTYILEWGLYDFIDDKWTLLLGSKYLLCAFAFSAMLIELNHKTLLYRSLISLICLDAWAGFIQFIIFSISNEEINLSAYTAIVFSCWFIFTLKKQYPERIDLVNLDNINILIKKPKTIIDVIYGLFGLSASSICICSNNSIWCFRKKSGIFEKTEYHRSWTYSHLVIDTGIKFTSEHKLILDNLVGTMRIPCIKCVFTIRYLLNSLGGKFTIKSWFDYIPGIYFMRII